MSENRTREERIEEMKTKCAYCRKWLYELGQSHGVRTAAYAKDIGVGDPTCSIEDIVRHDREGHEAELKALGIS